MDESSTHRTMQGDSRSALAAGAAEERSDRIAKRFERPLLAAAVLTIPVTILQLSSLSEPWRAIADVLNWAIWLTFLTEVVVMLAVVPSRKRWLREHPIEVAIVVLTPPILATVVQSARVLRLLRLMRLLRLAPLARALFTAERLRYAALLTILTAVAGGAGFAAVENRPVGDGIYWAITTMTTVGYGDITPRTPEGTAMAIAVMLVGIGFAALVIGAIAQRFITPAVHEVEDSEEDLLEQVRDISERLQRLERALQRQRPITERGGTQKG
jgi:voltage-gated potassium channel